MLAIHNKQTCEENRMVVANAFAKLSKCQQFTTQWRVEFTCVQLQTLLQSYQNVSNSQQSKTLSTLRNSCKRFCKVIKMLAIHNEQLYLLLKHYVANAFAKLSKCQQFTTSRQKQMMVMRLQTLLQSYQNVSNSQQT